MSTKFTDEDEPFLRAILSNPGELTAWLVYADWLDEHDDPRADFIRLEVRRGQLRPTDAEWAHTELRLRELRSRFDPKWLAVFDRPRIENCDEAFAFKCPKQWEQLQATADNAVRYCSGCKKLVYYCDTLDDAQDHARQGHCVAVQLGVRRYPRDLEPEIAQTAQTMMVGMINADHHRRASQPEPQRRPWWKFW